MVTVQSNEKIKVMENPAQKLNATAVQQVSDILEESEKVIRTEDTRTGYWSYRVPFAGVRYYSY